MAHFLINQQSAQRTFLYRFLRLALFCVFLTFQACASQPQNNYSIPLEHFGETQTPAENENQQYTLSPRDVIDVIYRFEVSQSEKYRIAPQDKLNIRFLTASKYDDIYQVRPDGFISLPMAGDVKVQGMTVEEVQQSLTAAYQNILKKPEFFVNLTEFNVGLKDIQKSLNRTGTGQGMPITVRDDSTVTLPYLGEISVHQKALAMLTQEINDRYKQLIPGMTVDMILQSSGAKELYVFGEVNKPGSHAISHSVPIFAAMALAGGANFNASLNTVLVLRKEGSEMVGRIYNFENILAGKASAVIIHPDDIVYVPRSQLSDAAQTMQLISNILLFRGLSVNYTYRLDDNY